MAVASLSPWISMTTVTLSAEVLGPLGLIAEGKAARKLLELSEQATTPHLPKQVSASLCLSFPLLKENFYAVVRKAVK